MGHFLRDCLPEPNILLRVRPWILKCLSPGAFVCLFCAAWDLNLIFQLAVLFQYKVIHHIFPKPHSPGITRMLGLEETQSHPPYFKHEEIEPREDKGLV